MPIRVLDSVTVGRIAAGEVVERPCSVVKELVENSLDAGATAVTVEIRGGGIEYIRVTDNGCGIDAGQLRLAFENHATSKLQNADQLDDIRTLGFRGEALPSIASVSKVEMTSRVRNSDSGARICIEGGQIRRIEEKGCPDGTTFEMRELFYNIPVRRAFLKKASYEGGLIGDVMASLMIGNPGVSMRFINNGTTVYHTFGDGSLRHAVFSVYGKTAAEKMIELNAAEGAMKLNGLIGVGDLAKHTRSHQLFFINGRTVRCGLLTKVLERVCEGRVTTGMYPMCAIHLTLPAGSVDVNVHPNKLQIRFRDEALMQISAEKLMKFAFEGERVLDIARKEPAVTIERVTQLREISSEEIVHAQDAKSAGQENKGKNGLPIGGKPCLSEAKMRDSSISVGSTREVKNMSETSWKPVMPALPVKTNSPGSNVNHAPEGPHCNESAVFKDTTGLLRDYSNTVRQTKLEFEPKQKFESKGRNQHLHEDTVQQQIQYAPESPKSSGKGSDGLELLWRVIGVVFKTYILVESGDDLLLIDQHAAHERLQYEKYMAQLSEGTASQQLLTPLVIPLTPREMALVMENESLLSQSGFTVEPFGDRDIQVRAVPYVLGKAELKPLFMEMLSSLDRLKSATIDARRAEVIQMACKSAVKAGDVLVDSEIEALLKEMMKTGAPPTCPHGRPVVKKLTRNELEKLFKRI